MSILMANSPPPLGKKRYAFRLYDPSAFLTGIPFFFFLR